MSKPRKLWWGYVKNILNRYPVYKTEYNSNHQLSQNDKKRMEAVEKSLEQAKNYKYGDLRCELIEKVYFEKTYSIEDFAKIYNMDYSIPLAWNKEFVYLVAMHLDLMEEC